VARKRKMTQKEFVRDQGNHCPVCGAHEVDFGFTEIDGDHSYQDCRCLECMQRFHTSYKLIGFVLED
jgi:transcription elongation factor Elf1